MTASMDQRSARGRDPDEAALPPPSWQVDTKFHPPAVRQGTVPRTELVDRLLHSAPTPIVCLAAPPGYGKTTVLAQWASQQQRQVAWVSLDAGDNDTSVLLTNTARALDRIQRIDPDVFRALASPGAATAVSAVARFAPALSAMTAPIGLVLDHAELLDNPHCLDAIADLAMRIPEGSQLAIATRGSPPLPTALLRSRRLIVEVGSTELTMDEREAGVLFEGAGVDVDDRQLAYLVRQTEGWPVGLYLAALALSAGGRRDAGVAFAGDHRLVADYLRSEFLSRLKPSVVSFLTRTAVLDQLSGPLCDAVLGVGGSAQILEELESSNLLLVPLDDHRHWYRYHHLFRELLRAELARDEPSLVPQLHARAAAWFEANGMPETAIGHAQSAGDSDRVARLVATLAQPAYAAGRVDTARRWFGWFSERGLMEQYPQVAVLGSLIEALSGCPAPAEHWAQAARRSPFTGKLPDGSPMDGWIAFLDVLLCRNGVTQMRTDAELALALLAPGSSLRAGVMALHGLACVMDGDIEAADPILAHAIEVATYIKAMPSVATALAERTIVAIERHEWEDAEAFSTRAMGVVGTGNLDDYLMTALVYAVAARVDIHRGASSHARDKLARAARLRPLLTYAVPASAQILLQMGHAYLELADPAGARAVLRDVRDILRQRPALGTIPRQADELQAMLETIRDGTLGASSLSTAELRLVPFLSTYLSLADIAARLHISRNTVKTQVISIYRKLGVSSRAAANERMREIGLLDR